MRDVLFLKVLAGCVAGAFVLSLLPLPHVDGAALGALAGACLMLLPAFGVWAALAAVARAAGRCAGRGR